ncbi:MAG: hypothetical protein H3Z54_09805 [archaeon]|nr:hypothetical protein [archaeon]MCP8316351.1 hypothetical protein [archaeon]
MDSKENPRIEISIGSDHLFENCSYLATPSSHISRCQAKNLKSFTIIPILFHFIGEVYKSLNIVEMESIQSLADKKKELEAKIQALEAEKAMLLEEIPRLSEKLDVLKLEHHAQALGNEISSLKAERSNLEQEIANYTNPQQASITS